MPIMTDAGFKEDGWTRLNDGEAIDGAVIVPFASLESRWGDLALSAEMIGVEIENDADLETLRPYLPELSLIVLSFPSFADGRAFSQAMRLRSMGFAGRLRAAGKIIADQFAYARRVGFDEVDVDAGVAARQPEDQWLRMNASQSLAYQRGFAAPRNILEARRSAIQAAQIAAE